MKAKPLTIEEPVSFRPTRVTDQIADWLRKRILTGEFGAGTRLPAERALAQHMDVTRNTLRAALARLETEELLELRHGSGAVVKSFQESGGLALSVHLLALGRDRETDILRGILEIRRGLAAEAVALAGQRITEEQLELLQQLADQLATETDQTSFIRLDMEFTRTVIRAAANLPMELMYNDTLRVIESRPDIDRLRFAELDTIRFFYQWTLNLIREGDPDRAREEMRRMLEAADEQALGLLQTAYSAREREN